MPFFSSPWEPIAITLQEQFEIEDFEYEAFSNDNFLETLVPTTEESGKFFGTNIFNIFIAQKAYGWVQCGEPNQREFQWPPTGFTEARQRYLDNLDRWPSYKCFVWVDFWTAQQNQGFYPTSDWLSMMEQTRTAIEEFCNTTQGFTYMGRIDSQVEAGFFEEVVTEFFKERKYKK